MDELQDFIDQFVAPEMPPRDDSGRPLLIPRGLAVEDANRVPYSRASSLGDILEEFSYLWKWKMRGLAVGLSQSMDLVRLASSEIYTCGFAEDERANRESGKRVDLIIERAMDRAGVDMKADYGTAIHSRTEPGNDNIDPDEKQAMDVASCWDLWTELGVVHLGTEIFTANDDLMSAGTFDHLSYVPGYGIIVTDKKGLPLDTPLPTPGGWTTMGEVQVGDEVFGSDGKPAIVLDKSEIHHKPCLRVWFEDGSHQDCDADHKWPVYLTRQKLQDGRKVQVLEASALADIISRAPRWDHFAVAVAEPLELPDADLPVPPYAVGAWLGDGTTSKPEITNSVLDREIIEFMRDGLQMPVTGIWEERRFETDNPVSRFTFTFPDLKPLITTKGGKRIPVEYLRASREQRLELLRGIMDTDGCWNIARNRATICSTLPGLAQDYAELIRSLGVRCRVQRVRQHGFGVDTIAHTVEFTPNFNPFRIARKADKVKHANLTKSRRLVIQRIEEIPTVPTQCIAVDSADQTYLCGREFFVTHNTSKSAKGTYDIQLASYAYGDVYDKDTDQRMTLEEYVFSQGWAPSLINRDVGLIWWVKGGKAQARFLDLKVGIEAARKAAWIRDERRKIGVAKDVTKDVRAAVSELRDSLLTSLQNAPSVEHITAVWNNPQARAIWTDEHSAAATARRESL